jgi:hypothetical protein
MSAKRMMLQCQRTEPTAIERLRKPAFGHRMIDSPPHLADHTGAVFGSAGLGRVLR